MITSVETISEFLKRAISIRPSERSPASLFLNEIDLTFNSLSLRDVLDNSKLPISKLDSDHWILKGFPFGVKETVPTVYVVVLNVGVVIL